MLRKGSWVPAFGTACRVSIGNGALGAVGSWQRPGRAVGMPHPDEWEDAKTRWTAYWQGEMVDRPVMLISVPREEPPIVPEPSSYEAKWTDIDYQIRSSEAQNRSRHYLGEAVPAVHGPMAAWCAYYGGPVTYMPDTIWFEPFLDSWDEMPDWARDWDDPGFRLLKRMMEALACARAGKYYLS